MKFRNIFIVFLTNSYALIDVGYYVLYGSNYIHKLLLVIIVFHEKKMNEKLGRE